MTKCMKCGAEITKENYVESWTLMCKHCDAEYHKQQQVAGGYNTVSGLFGSWDTPENRAELVRRYQQSAEQEE